MTTLEVQTMEDQTQEVQETTKGLASNVEVKTTSRVTFQTTKTKRPVKNGTCRNQNQASQKKRQWKEASASSAVSAINANDQDSS